MIEFIRDNLTFFILAVLGAESLVVGIMVWKNIRKRKTRRDN